MSRNVTKGKHRSKRTEILKALDQIPVDIVQLRKLAIAPEGLLTSELRAQVWPYLLNTVNQEIKAPENIRQHPEFQQVVLDVNRSMKRFPAGISDEEVSELQDQLTDLILSVLTLHPELNYYQGYHDICVTFLLACGPQLSFQLVERLSTHHLRDFMDPTMSSTTHILNYLIPILDKSDSELVKYITKSEVGTTFAISWLITWYSYVLHTQDEIERLYDFFLSCHPLMPIYFAAQIVLQSSEDIMAGECEMSRVYQILTQSARKPNPPLEELIRKSSDAFILFPPSHLAREAAEFYKNNLAISTFCDYALVARHETPDTVLRRLGIYPEDKLPKEKEVVSSSPKKNYWNTARTAVIAVSGAVGAVVVAASGLDWAPDLFNFL
nr:TBC1 domain family member 20-like [Ciona intestinalis]|eukprot:XP_026693327.1 TBC1 domain family member 20-like [Ciona intestinalis]